MGELQEGGGSVGPATIFFVTDGETRDYLSRASQHARGVTKMQCNSINLIKNIVELLDV